MTGTIYSHRWHPPSDVQPLKQGIYLLHGIGEHAGRYQRLAAYLTGLGYQVAAHDHPGHGKSAGKRGVIQNDDTLVDAATEQFQAFEREIGSAPLLFGHSLGGLVATKMVLDEKVNAAGLALSAPAYAPFISPFNTAKLKLLEIVAPQFTQKLPYHADRLTHDLIEQDKGRHDPLNHCYKSASIVGWIVRAGRQSIHAANRLSIPTLILIPGADVVVDANQTNLFIKNAPRTLITTHYYDGFRHELLNETPDRREQVMLDIEKWLSTL